MRSPSKRSYPHPRGPALAARPNERWSQAADLRLKEIAPVGDGRNNPPSNWMIRKEVRRNNERAPGRRAEKDTDESISADEGDEAPIKRANQSHKTEDESNQVRQPALLSF